MTTRAEGTCRFMTATHETTIDAAEDRVWRALVEETSRWWRDGFYALPNAVSMRIEARIGGAMVELAADGSAVVWANVIGIQPGRSLDLAGHLSAAFGGPALVLIRFDVMPKDRVTLVRASESRVGNVEGGAADACAKAWSALLSGGLKPFIERW